MNYNGYLITLEGNDGSGKTTQIELLKSKMIETYGDRVVFAREPGGSRIAEQIREIIMSKDNMGLCPTTELLLYEAARAQFCNDFLIPALVDGKVVVCDRFYDSTYAYQGCGRGLNLNTIQTLNTFAVGHEIKPNLTIWLKVNPKIGNKRRADAGDANRMDIQAECFYQAVEDGYQCLAEKNKRFVSIQPQSIEDTHKEIWKITSKKTKTFITKKKEG